MSVREDLEKMDGVYKEAEVREGFKKVPDGTYQAEVIEAYVDYSKNSGRLQFRLTFAILNGEYENSLLFKSNLLDDEMGVSITKEDLYKLGLPLEKLSDLPANSLALIKTKVQVKVVTKGEYQNVYIQKAITTEDAPVNDLPF